MKLKKRYTFKMNTTFNFTNISIINNQYTQPILKCNQFYYIEIQKNITFFLMFLLIVKYIITFKEIQFQYKDKIVFYLDGFIFMVCCGLTGSFIQNG